MSRNLTTRDPLRKTNHKNQLIECSLTCKYAMSVDPLLYDRLIRRFQTPAEREAEGRAKGYARVLEGSLMRGEERLAKLREQTETTGQEEDLEEEGEGGDDALAGGTIGRGGGLGGPTAAAAGAGAGASLFGAVTIRTETAGNGSGSNVPEPDTRTDSAATEPGPEPGTTFSALDAELGPPARTRAEGRAQWEAFLRDRFIRGEDDDFEYARVDDDDEYDVLERREREEAWFDAEDPGWVASDSTADSGEEKVLKGETGVQDF